VPASSRAGRDDLKPVNLAWMPKVGARRAACWSTRRFASKMQGSRMVHRSDRAMRPRMARRRAKWSTRNAGYNDPHKSMAPEAKSFVPIADRPKSHGAPHQPYFTWEAATRPRPMRVRQGRSHGRRNPQFRAASCPLETCAGVASFHKPRPVTVYMRAGAASGAPRARDAVRIGEARSASSAATSRRVRNKVRSSGSSSPSWLDGDGCR